jgi:tryptophanyl-tRNA synthetase
MARRFNGRFGPTFALPEMLREMVKVPGLDGEKMGKSEADNAIDINSPMDVIRKRYLERGITDPERKRVSDPGNPYIRCRSVYPLHELITPGETDGREIAKACMAARIGCAECKKRLVHSIAAILEPFQERRAALADKNDYAREVLHEGGKRARQIIKGTVEQVRDKMGIIVY